MRRNYVEGVAVKFNKYSEWRVKPFCENFAVCGGCKWQDFNYEQQLVFKHKNITDCLKRIGNLELPAISSIIAAERTSFYRNKLEFTFSSNRWLTNEEVKSEEPNSQP